MGLREPGMTELGLSLGDSWKIRDSEADSISHTIWEGMVNLALIWAVSVFKDIWSGVCSLSAVISEEL